MSDKDVLDCLSNEEILKYLLSLDYYSNEDDLFYEEQMLETDGAVRIRDLIERFVSVDQEYNGEPWNIAQILANVAMVPTQEEDD